MAGPVFTGLARLRAVGTSCLPSPSVLGGEGPGVRGSGTQTVSDPSPPPLSPHEYMEGEGLHRAAPKETPMRTLAALLFGLVLATSASAHFVFIVHDLIGEYRVIFSDTLKPDENVPIEKVATTKAFLREMGGKVMPLE